MGRIYLSSKGLRPGIDNSPVINRVIESAKDGSTIVFTDGNFNLNTTIVQSKRINWEGADNTNLVASVPLTFARFTKAEGFTVSRINFSGFYSIGDLDKPEKMDAVLVSSVMRMQDCQISNAWGNGISVYGNISAGIGNASACRFDNIYVGQCRDNGFYFQGGDTNQSSIFHADVRDCNGIGIWDNSFLGNQFFSCMTHNNRKGSYKAGDDTDLNNQNTRAGFFGCYAERGQGPIILCGHSMWYGGLAADNFKLFNFSQTWL